MKKYINQIAVILLIFLSFQSYAQNEDENWIFGNPGPLDVPVNFELSTLNNISTSPLPPASTGGGVGEDLEFMGSEGTVVASDPVTGQLLFYTDGDRLWDGNHNLEIANLGGHSSSTQPAAVCVVPICPFDSFYVFSNPTNNCGNGCGATSNVITYRKYDKVTGTFSATSTPLPFPNTIPAVQRIANEGMIIIPSRQNSLEFYLISRSLNQSSKNWFVVHKIDASGVSYINRFDMGPSVGGPSAGSQFFGNLTYTADRASLAPTDVEIAVASSWRVYTLTFNTATETITYKSSIKSIPTNLSQDVLYDVEYSPSGDYLYYSTYLSNVFLYQYDLIGISEVVHSFNDLNAATYDGGGGGLKRGSDGNVYHITQSRDGAGGTAVVEVGRIIDPDSPMPAVGVPTPLPTSFYETNVINIGTNLYSAALNLPEFVTTPLWDAEIAIVGDTIFCDGDPVVLSATFTGSGVTPALYNWYLNGAFVTSTTVPTYSATQSGNWQVEIVLNNGCSQWSNILTIQGVTCCLAAIDTQYTHITAPITYFTDVVWDDKYYIDDNVIVTVSAGAVLDITNVDVVFGECAGIVFEKKAYLRANNSVFRPCNVDGSWKGIVFDGTDGQSTFDNIINESTFKNAEVALYFQKGADGVVSNNLFSNCNYGVRIDDNNRFNHPISGNNFVLESFYPKFLECYGFVDNTKVYGVYTERSWLQEISQNGFINSNLVNAPTFFGIHETSSGGTISENTFTNINTSVTINSPKFPTRIENNEIEINRKISNISSISVFGSDGVIVEINNNELENNNHSNALNNAIYVEKSNHISVFSNRINGYDIGVHMFSCGATQTAYNVLTEIAAIGIYYNKKASGIVRKYITCNDITMASFKGTIGILSESNNQGLQITTNCVKDAEQSIRLLGNGKIPYVRNNYLYNYSQYGVFNDFLSGNIGTFVDPGMNTFWSNDNSAIDIFSNTLIQVADNFGVFNITFATVQITSNNPYHSTASCGHQIFNMPSQGNLNTSLLCDNFESIMNPVEKNSNLYSFKSNFLQTLSVDEYQFLKANMLLSSQEVATETLLNDVVASTNLSNNKTQLLKYLFYYREGDFQQAQSYLNLYAPITDVGLEYKALNMLDVDISENNYQLTNSDIQMLQSILYSEDEEKSLNFAAYLLKSTDSHPDYIYAPYRESGSAEDLEVKRIGDEDEFLSIFPNPAVNSVVIELVSNQIGSKLQLFDLSGKVVTDYVVEIVAGQITLDIHDLSEGVYFVTLTNPKSGFTQKGKIIKVKE